MKFRTRHFRIEAPVIYVLTRVFLLLLVTLLLPISAKTPDNQGIYAYFTEQVKEQFEVRMSEYDGNDDEHNYIPPVVFSEKISANAMWSNDTIRLGRSFFTQSFLTQEDRLSILYHEYQHYQNQLVNRYPCQKDLSGSIVQVETDILFTRELTHAEIEQDYTEMVSENMTEAEKVLLWQTVSTPSLMRFRYAPSNLARDEIFCYRSELEANRAGIFRLSTVYRDYLVYRIKREQAYLQMRLDFEERNNLNVDGSSFLF